MKIEKSPLDNISDWRKASSSIGPRTKARTRGRAVIAEFSHQVPDDTEDEHDDHIADAVVKAVSSDEAEEQDQGIEKVVGNLQDLHPEPDQREIQDQKHHISDIHAHDGPPEKVGSFGHQERPGL